MSNNQQIVMNRFKVTLVEKNKKAIDERLSGWVNQEIRSQDGVQ